MQNVFVKWLILVVITLILGNFVGWLNVREFKKRDIFLAVKKKPKRKCQKTI